MKIEITCPELRWSSNIVEGKVELSASTFNGCIQIFSDKDKPTEFRVFYPFSEVTAEEVETDSGLDDVADVVNCYNTKPNDDGARWITTYPDGTYTLQEALNIAKDIHERLFERMVEDKLSEVSLQFWALAKTIEE